MPVRIRDDIRARPRLRSTGLHRLSRLLGAMLLLSTGVAVAADVDLSLANRAGRKRMLSQRLVKSYLQIGIAANTALAQRQFDAAASEFESTMRELRKVQGSRALTAAVASVKANC